MSCELGVGRRVKSLERIQTATELFENALSWLRENYSGYRFYVERDIVWTMQTRLRHLIDELALPYQVFNDYPMLPGPRRSLSADLVIRAVNSGVEVAVEFKYEPSHNRSDILKQKLPVVEWGGVERDAHRIQEFVNKGKTEVAYAVFVDEGGLFLKRPLPVRSVWQEWEQGVWILQSQVTADISVGNPYS